MRAHNNSIQQWVELYEQPAPGKKVTRSLSLCKFGPGLSGFPGIAHGGALLTILDEALAYIMIANAIVEIGPVGMTEEEEATWKKLHAEGKPIQETLKGRFVTAKLDTKFLKPVLCPGVVGVTVEMLESKEYKLKMRGIMRDESGAPLLQVDGLWVKIGGGAKL